MTAPLPASAFKPNGNITASAMVQRQKFRLTGSNASRSARPITQLPAHTRLVSARSEKAVRRALEAGSVRLLVGVIGRAYERSDGGMAKAHCLRLLLILRKNGRLDIALHRQVMRRRLQVLADRQHVDIVRAQVAHDGEDFAVFLAKADHQPRLRRHGRMNALELLQQLERMEVMSARPRSLVEARHGLEV